MRHRWHHGVLHGWHVRHEGLVVGAVRRFGELLRHDPHARGVAGSPSDRCHRFGRSAGSVSRAGAVRHGGSVAAGERVGRAGRGGHRGALPRRRPCVRPGPRRCQPPPRGCGRRGGVPWRFWAAAAIRPLRAKRGHQRERRPDERRTGDRRGRACARSHRTPGAGMPDGERADRSLHLPADAQRAGDGRQPELGAQPDHGARRRRGCRRRSTPCEIAR